MNTYFQNIVLLTFALFLAHASQGRHIIGGDLYYECRGNGNYNFTMTIYRDCSPFDGAGFDSAPGEITGTVTIYRSDRTAPFIETVSLNRPQITNIDPETDNPCLIVPPNVCVERGIYNFSVNLPPSQFSYHIVYQRCCRNNTISNLVAPGRTGATYTIELTPEAQQSCNSSIQFNNFPPVVICQNEPLEFDHSAFDPDQDSSITIEYEFCPPFQGGGLRGTGGNPGDPTGPNGVAPNPDTRPPFDEVIFVGGEFTSFTPLGGDPVIRIDPETGMITGTPNVLGQYVVGVCATEYDSSGNVISLIRRDFQFNVAQCDRKVFAEIEADLQNGSEFVINSCGSTTVNFINQSYQEEFINSYKWAFEINGSTDNYLTKDPTVTFPGLGTYNGQMILNEGTACSDTADIEVNIYGSIDNQFTYEYDTCVAGPISLMGSEMTENGSIIDRSWYFENNDSLKGQNTSYEYLTPGDKLIQYVVTDDVGCTSLAEVEVPYFPIPNEIIVDIQQSGECVPINVFFNNQSYPLDSNYLIEWNFGDGGTSEMISPVHTYESPGTYNIDLSIISPIGCMYEGELDETIQTIPSPEAAFTYQPTELNQFNRVVNFIDQSMDAVEWIWSFGAEGISNQQNPIYEFPDTGFYNVEQIVVHENGCRDTATASLDVKPKVTYFLPNAFTPNNDGRNDEFLGRGDLIGVQSFEMLIYNRWGELVFQTNDPNRGWNGRKNNSGPLLPQAVYVVKVTYIGPRGERFQQSGFATLVAN